MPGSIVHRAFPAWMFVTRAPTCRALSTKVYRPDSQLLP